MDSSFILTCVRQKIDFFEEIELKGIQILIPKQVIREIKGIDTLNSNIENLEISMGKIGGPSQILNPHSSDSVTNLLKDDIEKFEN